MSDARVAERIFSGAVPASPSEEAVWTLLRDVFDPEIPTVSIVDLGIVRGISVDGVGCQVTITPTYSGCPAMELIEQMVVEKLSQSGVDPVLVVRSLSPAWTTDWMTPLGRERLRESGIAPPVTQAIDISALKRTRNALVVPCPNCRSTRTRVLSQFGSTACKALYRCEDCLEPFDYFKSH